MKRLWYSIWPCMVVAIAAAIILGSAGAVLVLFCGISERTTNIITVLLCIPVVIFIPSKYDSIKRWKSYTKGP